MPGDFTSRSGFQWADLLWALAYPVYQIVGTIRHEGSHALAALLEGATINEFVFWPTRQEDHLVWGYVDWSGSTSWFATAAPYLADLITFFVFFYICTRIRFKRRWLWVNAVIIGLVSPMIDSAYNYMGYTNQLNDVGRLLMLLPAAAVHAYFLSTIALYCLGLLTIAYAHRVPTQSGLR